MEDIKNSVRAHLQKAGEANVKQIAKATGHSETEVINALNAMRVYADVECAQGGRGKGMTYWLTKVDAPVTAKPESKPAAAKPAEKIPAPQYDPDSVAFTAADHSKALRNEIADLKEQIKGHEGLTSNLRAILGIKEGHSIRLAIEKLQSDLGHSRIQIDALNEQLMAGDEAIDIKDATRGYLVCAPKRKPANVTKAESAVARAKSAAKSAGRSEVFALVPVGVATRKQVLAVEFKGKAA